MQRHVERVQVIEPRALELAIVERKAERLDQMQRATGRRAEPGDVPGVRRNLRLDQHDVQRRVRRDVLTDAVARLARHAASAPKLRDGAFRYVVHCQLFQKSLMYSAGL